jgi:phosphatidate cytidylyltransferase
MSDLHAINEAINKRAGRKLLPSIAVGLLLLAIIFSTMAFIPELFALFVGIAVLIALREMTSALRSRDIDINFLHLSVTTALVLLSAWVGGLPGLSVSIVIGLISILFLVLLKGTEGFIKNATASAFALMYPGFVAGFIFLLARSGEGFSYIATLVILVGCNDTFAYVFGVLFGKHPLAAKISPKKTWEGFLGGMKVAAVIIDEDGEHI